MDRGNGRAVLTLFLLAPVVGEVVGASLRLSYFAQPLRVLGIVCFYGAGVVLIREITQRLHLSGWGLVLLGCAFALVEEGLALQTIFNPVGMDGEAVHGSAFGVNWFWAVVVTGYHVVWTVGIPIAVVHLVFPRSSHSPWLSARSAGMLAVVFACGTAVFVAISHLRSDFWLSWVQAAATIVVVAGLVWLATMCKDDGRAASAGRVPRRIVVGMFGFVAGAGWFVLFVAAFVGGAGFVWWTVGALCLASAAALMLRRWTRREWTSPHQLALCFGATVSAALFGLLLVAQDARREDIAFQCAVIAALITAYIWMDHRGPNIMSNNAIEICTTTADRVASLLGPAVGGGQPRLQRAIQRYRDDPATALLAAVVDDEIVGVIGYAAGDSEVTVLHIATAPHARGAGVGTHLLAAVRRAFPAGVPIVAETDEDALGFYTANDFTATSLGEKYPGVERFRVHLEASSADPT